MAATAVIISPLVKQQFNQNGSALAGGRLFTYAAGTTNKLATYTDSTGTVPNTNPIQLDGNGQCDLWLASGLSYKFVLAPPGTDDPPTNIYWSEDNISAGTGATNIIFDGVTLAVQFQTRVNRVVPSISALRALNTSTYNYAFVEGYYNQGDGGGGAYYYDPTDTTSVDNGGTIIVGNDLISRWKLTYKNSINVKQFGAKGDGVTDDTVAIQNAINTGLATYFPSAPKGYRITNMLTINTQGQRLYGDGSIVSTIFADSSFNMSAQAFIKFNASPTPVSSQPGYGPGSIPGIVLQDLKITCIQPDTSVRANLTAYPVQIYAQNQPRFQLINVALTQGINGIDMRGNSGGVIFDRCSISGYGTNVQIDGALDSVKFQTCHFWPFDLTANQTNIYNSSGTVGIAVARCDDLHIEDTLLFPYQALVPSTGGTGVCFGEIVGCDFDTNCNVDMSANLGDLRFSCCYFSTAGAGRQWMQVTNGQRASFDSCSFSVGVADTTTLVQVTGSPGGIAKFSNCTFQTGASDQTMFNVSGAGTGVNTPTATFVGCRFQRNPGQNFSSPMVAQGANGRIVMTGNTVDDIVSGTNVVLAIGTDDYHNITGNNFGGGTVGLPTTRSYTVFADNNFVSGGFKDLGQASLTTNSVGNVTVPHNYGIAPTGVLINVVNASTPIFAQATGFTGTQFQVNFWTAGGSSLNNTAIIFDWKLLF